MTARLVAVLVVSALLSSACARTVYTNLHPDLVATRSDQQRHGAEPKYWRNFFVFGWAPGERVIDAAEECGGTEHVARIETSQSFLQGLLAFVTTYYVSIYTPYTGRVVCDDHDSEP